MAHFAQLDENNMVINVVVVDDQHEEDGENWCVNFFGGGVWKRTSYNTYQNTHLLGGTPFRKNYAGIGYVYDEQRDAFIRPKPFNSWVINEQMCDWVAPVPYPSDGGIYAWDENAQSWVNPLPPEQQLFVSEV